MIPGNVQSVGLRPAEADDEAFLFRLYGSTRAEELADWGWNAAQQEAFLKLQFRGQQAHYDAYPNTDHRIILCGGQPVGRLLVSRLTEEIRLVDISILTENRGRGVGANLIRDLLAEAARSDLPVRLHVEKFNRAQQLYRRLGFEIIGDTGSHYFMEWRSSM